MAFYKYKIKIVYYNINILINTFKMSVIEEFEGVLIAGGIFFAGITLYELLNNSTVEKIIDGAGNIIDGATKPGGIIDKGSDIANKYIDDTTDFLSGKTPIPPGVNLLINEIDTILEFTLFGDNPDLTPYQKLQCIDTGFYQSRNGNYYKCDRREIDPSKPCDTRVIKYDPQYVGKDGIAGAWVNCQDYYYGTIEAQNFMSVYYQLYKIDTFYISNDNKYLVATINKKVYGIFDLQKNAYYVDPNIPKNSSKPLTNLDMPNRTSDCSIFKKSNKDGLYRSCIGPLSKMATNWIDIQYNQSRIVLFDDSRNYLIGHADGHTVSAFSIKLNKEVSIHETNQFFTNLNI